MRMKLEQSGTPHVKLRRHFIATKKKPERRPETHVASDVGEGCHEEEVCAQTEAGLSWFGAKGFKSTSV